MSIKQDLESTWGDTTIRAQRVLQEDFARYKFFRVRKIFAIFFLIIGTPAILFFTLAAVALINSTSSIGPYIVMLVAALCISAFFLLRMDFKFSVERFNYQLNKFLYPLIYQVLGVDGTHQTFFTNKVADANEMAKQTNIFNKNILGPIWRKFGYKPYELNQGLYREVLQMASDSSLIVDQVAKMYIDDVYDFTVSNIPCRFAEINFENRIRAKGKEYKIPVTKGYLARLDISSLNRDSGSNKVFIASEKDTKLFSSKYFWEFLHFAEDQKLQEVTSVFQNTAEHIRIAAYEPSRVQALLSDELVRVVDEYVKVTKDKVRISFIGAVVYVLIPSHDVSLSEPVGELSTEELQKHALETAEPMSFVLRIAGTFLP